MFDSGYAELHAHTAYTFGEGVCLPDELVAAATAAQLNALAITDRDGLYAVVQAHDAAARHGLPLICGTEVTLEDRTRLPILASSPEGYHALSRALSLHALAHSTRRDPAHSLTELATRAEDWLILTGDHRGPLRTILSREGPFRAEEWLREAINLFGADRIAIETCLEGHPDDDSLADYLADLASRTCLPLVATTSADIADPADIPLAHLLAARRDRSTLNDAYGVSIDAHPRFLRSPADMRQLHRRHPHAVPLAAELARDLTFDLSLIAPRLPNPDVPPGYTPATWLRHLTAQGASDRWGEDALRPPVSTQLTHELDLIEHLDFPGYFLIVNDIVTYCRTHGILAQGRGSAANSAVCYALGITAVDAVTHRLHFERFLSTGRSGPPDIDIDIEASRREEVITYVYNRYGRERAAQVATVITYRPRSALRDAARALGYPEGTHSTWHATSFGGAHRNPLDNPDIPALPATLATRMTNLPRHMGIHSGGMVLCDRPVIDICPVTWAATPGRTVLQWDKEDCASAGLVKFDLLGLGMLTALRLAFTSLTHRAIAPPRGTAWDIAAIPDDDPLVYDLLTRADTIGVFQVESRAQMATLPRLKPRCFYDLVIEVALIRPGPIQGQAVNPYLARRTGREPITYPHPLTRPILEKTLGVPLFQEQLMQLAERTAGFTPAQADALRKAISSSRSRHALDSLKPLLFDGMAARGLDREAAETIWGYLQGFADFGFPESHAFSFARLVYASAWLKAHHPHDFYAALLAAQPMGFYSPLTLVDDAKRHGVEVRRADVAISDVHAKVVSDPDGHLAVQLGLAPIQNVGERRARRLVSERERGPFGGIDECAERTGLPARCLESLAAAGAFDSLEGERRAAMWRAGAAAKPRSQEDPWYQPTLPGVGPAAPVPCLPPLTDGEVIASDVAYTGTATTGFPTQLVRRRLRRGGVDTIDRLTASRAGQRCLIAGIVTHRQRPHTACGTTFLSLEDETGLANIICSPGMWERYRGVLTTAQALVVRGRVEAGDGACALVAEKAWPLDLAVATHSRDFR
ncbi:MAG: error-prone DNA polymerase [Actinomycetaceae bacterium]|nr:error-prone DNA polymerase [Actinomycetaceae bacterium]